MTSFHIINGALLILIRKPLYIYGNFQLPFENLIWTIFQYLTYYCNISNSSLNKNKLLMKELDSNPNWFWLIVNDSRNIFSSNYKIILRQSKCIRNLRKIVKMRKFCCWLERDFFFLPWLIGYLDFFHVFWSQIRSSCAPKFVLSAVF